MAILLAICLLAAGCGRPETAKESTAADTASGSVQTNEHGLETAETEGSESASGYPVFDFERKTVTLNSGYEMPILGIGTYALSDTQAENSVYWALKAGFRLIDTARIYGNEAAVGKGLKRAIDEGVVTREEVFITTKMWTSDYDDGDAAVDAP